MHQSHSKRQTPGFPQHNVLVRSGHLVFADLQPTARSEDSHSVVSITVVQTEGDRNAQRVFDSSVYIPLDIGHTLGQWESSFHDWHISSCSTTMNDPEPSKQKGDGLP